MSEHAHGGDRVFGQDFGTSGPGADGSGPRVAPTQVSTGQRGHSVVQVAFLAHGLIVQQNGAVSARRPLTRRGRVGALAAGIAVVAAGMLCTLARPVPTAPASAGEGNFR